MTHITKSTGLPDKRIKRSYPTRPPKPIDWNKVDELLLAGCTGTEIASHFDMHPDTFYRRVEEEKSIGYTAYSQQKKQQGESILRAHQYAKALGITKDGDNTLLIWLGKQRLNQCETPQEASADAVALKHFEALMSQLTTMQKIEEEKEAQNA